MSPGVEFLFPGVFFGLDFGGALGLVGVTGQGAGRQALEQLDGHRLGVAVDAHGDFFDQAQIGVVGFNLDDLGLFGPVVHAVLGQGAKRPHARAQRHHHVGLGDQLHGGLGALVTQRACPQRVAGREGVVAQIAVGHGRAQALGQGHALLDRIAHDHTAARQNDRKLRVGQQLHGGVQAVFAARAAFHAHGLGNFAVDFAIKIVTRNVQLGGTHFRDGAVKAACGELGHALGVVHMALVFGEFLKHGQLLRLLEAAQAHAHGAGFGGDHDHRAVRPIGRRNGGDAVADARAVLANDHAMAAAHTGITIGHVRPALLVHHRNQSDACGGKNVHGVHEGRAHDAEHVGHAVGDHGFHKGLGGRHFLHATGHGAFVGFGGAHGLLLKK